MKELSSGINSKESIDLWLFFVTWLALPLHDIISMQARLSGLIVLDFKIFSPNTSNCNFVVQLSVHT